MKIDTGLERAGGTISKFDILLNWPPFNYSLTGGVHLQSLTFFQIDPR